MIIHFRGVAFCFLMFWPFFCVFVVLQVMKFGVLFFMECWHPNWMLVVEHFFLDFFFW